MSLRTVLLGLMLTLIALFAALNWPAIVAPTQINLLVAEAEAPLGLVLLAFLAVEAVAFLTYIAVMQAQRLSDARRLMHEAREQRELAEKAEASRYTELRRWLEQELSALRQDVSTVSGEVVAQTRRLDEGLRQAINDNGNGLAAALGEIEDKLDRQAQANPSSIVSTTSSP
ncbi:LapA family protein [Caldimonas manganoxidans]|uniref:LapA family protein n=1 Tax=Caldimonas manganoxidans TaxID=196015 RepID=UPI000375DA81|nr:LapA family protein [Caldimonas manganoxidans]